MQAMPKAVGADADRDALLALNAEYIRCVREADAAAFDRFLAPDFVCTQSDGTRMEREAFLRHAAQPPKISALEAEGVDVRLMGDFAIVLGQTSFRRPDGTTGRGCYTDVYAKRGERWLAIGAHVTRF
jgi:ketosteroid isomerase-like protein